MHNHNLSKKETLCKMLHDQTMHPAYCLFVLLALPVCLQINFFQLEACQRVLLFHPPVSLTYAFLTFRNYFVQAEHNMHRSRGGIKIHKQKNQKN